MSKVRCSNCGAELTEREYERFKIQNTGEIRHHARIDKVNDEVIGADKPANCPICLQLSIVYKLQVSA